MNCRDVIAGAAALPLAAAIPAVVAEAAAPVCEIDRVAVAGRFHKWALHVPQLGDRIDAMLARLDYVLSTSEGTVEFLETVELSRDPLGRDVSLDWLIGGDVIYPSGHPVRMFYDEPGAEAADRAEAALVRDFRVCSVEQQDGLMALARALKRRDYAAARHWRDHLNRLDGITVEQI